MTKHQTFCRTCNVISDSEVNDIGFPISKIVPSKRTPIRLFFTFNICTVCFAGDGAQWFTRVPYTLCLGCSCSASASILALSTSVRWLRGSAAASPSLGPSAPPHSLWKIRPPRGGAEGGSDDPARGQWQCGVNS